MVYASRSFQEETRSAGLVDVFTPADIELSETLYCLWTIE